MNERRKKQPEGVATAKQTPFPAPFFDLSSGNTIWLDDKAAAWGSFVDPTPSDESEFLSPGDQGEQDRMDLLTAVMHELGHVLGHDHDDGGVMAETLAAGVRSSPTELLSEYDAALLALIDPEVMGTSSRLRKR